MSDFSAGNERKKKKTGEGNEASLAGLSEEERALILQMREAKEEEQGGTASSQERSGQGRGERRLLEQPGRLVRKHRPDLL